MKTLLAIGIGILFVPWLASAEDFIWQGKKYIDVRVISIDKKKMVGLSSKKKGNFKVPYNRLSWTLKKEADIVVKKQKEELLKEGEKFFGARPEEPTVASTAVAYGAIGHWAGGDALQEAEGPESGAEPGQRLSQGPGGRPGAGPGRGQTPGRD